MFQARVVNPHDALGVDEGRFLSLIVIVRTDTGVKFQLEVSEVLCLGPVYYSSFGFGFGKAR